MWTWLTHWLQIAYCAQRFHLKPSWTLLVRFITFRIDFDLLSRSCNDIYRVAKEVIQKFLKGFDGQVSLSLDVLKKPDDFRSYLHCRREKYFCYLGYMCLRVHLVDENWKMRNLVLEFCRADAEVYIEIILNCLKEFNIMNKISTIMVPDDFDSEKICGAIKSKIQGKEKPQHMFPVICCASLLLSMVEDAFEAIEVNKFLELDGFKRVFPMWSIILGQLTRTLELEASGYYNNDEMKKWHEIPSAEEWKRLGDVCRLVNLVNAAAEVFYKTNNVTAAIYLYNLQKLRAALIRESISSDQFISKMVLGMLQKLYNYWKDMFMVLAFVTILDPRCKLKFIEFVSFKYEGEAGNSKIGLVLEAFHNMYNEYETQFAPAVGLCCSESEHKIREDLKNENKLPENPRSKTYYFDVYAHFINTSLLPCKTGLENHSEEPVSSRTQFINCMSLLRAGLIDENSESDSDSGSTEMAHEHMKNERKRLANPRLPFDSWDEYNHFTPSNFKVHKSELDLYLKEPVSPWSQDLNLLDWWRAASTKYPTLGRMARNLIAIPLSLSTNDDAYYTDLRSVDIDLIQLEKDLSKAVICTRTWLEICKTHLKK